MCAVSRNVKEEGTVHNRTTLCFKTTGHRRMSSTGVDLGSDAPNY